MKIPIDKFFESLSGWSVPTLRVMLGVVFLWFGLLKIFGVSPVAQLIQATYSFLPQQQFLIFLGVWEVVIGLGFIFKIAPKFILVIFWFQMAGTFTAIFLDPSIFFNQGNPLLLTTDGEFVIKNLVLITAGAVIGGHDKR